MHGCKCGIKGPTRLKPLMDQNAVVPGGDSQIYSEGTYLIARRITPEFHISKKKPSATLPHPHITPIRTTDSFAEGIRVDWWPLADIFTAIRCLQKKDLHPWLANLLPIVISDIHQVRLLTHITYRV